MNEVKIRLAQGSDTPALLHIYAPYILNTSITFEYEVPSFAEFASRIEAVTRAFPWFVCEIDGQAAGYIYAAPYKARAAFQWDAEISVYLSPDFHRMGIASALYSCLENILIAQGYLNLYALITVPNPVSVGFHESKGFRPVCVYRNTGFKQGAWHDMTVLEKQLTPLPENPQKCKTFLQLDPAFLTEQIKTAENAIKGKIKEKQSL
jgi:L-amino acid N-acyltransferase YncA